MSLLKINNLGDLIWKQTFPIEHSGGYVIQTKDGKYAVSGTTSVNRTTVHSQAFLTKLDSQGNIVWNKTLEHENTDDRVNSFIETDDGGYVIVGQTEYPEQINPEAFIIKTDSDGNIHWFRTCGQGASSHAWSIAETKDNSYSIFGTRDGFWLIKTDMNGVVQWNKTYNQNLEPPPTQTVAYARSGILTSDGGHVIVGSLSGIKEIAWVVKTDSLGNVQWNKTYGTSNKNVFNHVLQTSDGGYVFSGLSNYKAWIVKTDSKGSIQWNATYDYTLESTGKSIVETENGEYVLVGTSSDGIWLAKITPPVILEFPLWIFPSLLIISILAVFILRNILIQKRIE